MHYSIAIVLVFLVKSLVKSLVKKIQESGFFIKKYNL